VNNADLQIHHRIILVMAPIYDPLVGRLCRNEHKMY